MFSLKLKQIILDLKPSRCLSYSLVVVMCASTHATTESVAVNVTFVKPITIVEDNTMGFGLLDRTMEAGEQVTIDTADTVTADSGSNVIGGIQQSAQVTIASTPGVAVTLQINNLASGTYYVLGQPRCTYDVQTEASCVSRSLTSVDGAVVLVGMTLTKNAVALPAAGATDNSSFDVVLTFD